jgi:predicted nucleic acid-binding protein
VTILLDTCVISELVKPNPEKKVTDWIADCPEETIYLSVVTIGEIQKGISKLPACDKKKRLQRWLNIDLMARFENHIVPIDRKIARVWGRILAQTERNGRPIPAVDGLIAATGLARDMTVVTRNEADMDVEGLSVFNPWNKA